MLPVFLNHIGLNCTVMMKYIHSVDMLGAVGDTKDILDSQILLPALCWVVNTSLSIIDFSLFPTFSHSCLFLVFIFSFSLQVSLIPFSLFQRFTFIYFMSLDYSFSLFPIPFLSPLVFFKISKPSFINIHISSPFLSILQTCPHFPDSLPLLPLLPPGMPFPQLCMPRSCLSFQV